MLLSAVITLNIGIIRVKWWVSFTPAWDIQSSLHSFTGVKLLYTIKKTITPNSSDLVKTKEVGIMCMSKITGVRNIHKNSVVFLQLQDRAQVTLWGPGEPSLLRAKTGSVGLHQGHSRGKSYSPHKHCVNKWGCRGTVFKDQLHTWVNVVESGLVDLQSTVFKPVSHPSRYERSTQMWLPPQSLVEMIFFDASCKRRGIMLL